MNKIVTNRLPVFRAMKRISQQELATAIGVSRKTISTIETGKFTPSVQIALAIAEYFDTRVEDVFQLTKESNDAARE